MKYLAQFLESETSKAPRIELPTEPTEPPLDGTEGEFGQAKFFDVLSWEAYRTYRTGPLNEGEFVIGGPDLDGDLSGEPFGGITLKQLRESLGAYVDPEGP